MLIYLMQGFIGWDENCLKTFTIIGGISSVETFFNTFSYVYHAGVFTCHNVLKFDIQFH